MENTNYRKKLARLRYQDEILEMHKSGKSIRDIMQDINYRLARTNLKVTGYLYIKVPKATSDLKVA